MSKRQSKRPLHRVEQQRQVQPRMPKLSRPHGLFSCWENELPGLRLPPDHFDSDRHGSLHSRSPGLRPGLGRAALLLAGGRGLWRRARPSPQCRRRAFRSHDSNRSRAPQRYGPRPQVVRPLAVSGLGSRAQYLRSRYEPSLRRC
jgi:hypothetical protein